ncbi:hypothetical protein BDQ17DRAFT_1391657 [Cyathus striatus]|nr:hypothetical protein BDQ17DRAFT_1391657 [Cyathus striatus]
MTQSSLYKAIKAKKKVWPRMHTQRNLDTTAHALDENTGKHPNSESIWKSLQNGATLTKKSKTFHWKLLHDAHRVGHHWEHTTVSNEFMPCTYCDVNEESMTHILLECGASGQQHVWRLARATWQSTDLPWPHISIGLIMGIMLAEIRSPEGDVLKGPMRLFRILVSEAAYLIWKLRCDWRIGEEGNTAKIHTPSTIEAKWMKIVNTRINHDRILTDSHAYGKKALKRQLVVATWQQILENNRLIDALPDKWLSRSGVLVGIKKLVHYRRG